MGGNPGTDDGSSNSETLAADADRVFAAALRHHKAGRQRRLNSTNESREPLPNLRRHGRTWGLLSARCTDTRRRSLVYLAPEDAAAHSNLANALRSVGRLDEAAACHRRSLELSPDAAGIHYNFALVLRDSGDIGAALQQFERPEELGYRSPDLHWDRALAFLTNGDLTRGFADYEWRWRLPEVEARSLPGSPWKGESLEGCTLFVYAEQGFGDTIQFSRYVPMVAQKVDRVVFECQAPLFRLFSESRIFDDVELVRQGEKVPEFDAHVALLTLPHLLGTTRSTIPADVPYLTAPSRSENLQSRRAQLTVGLAWTGKPTHRNDRNRSIKLEQLAPLLQMPDAHFVSLQVGAASQEIAALGFASIVDNLAPALKDFADTASAIDKIDLVIGVDSAVVHLAGALGRPVWTLIPYVPDWRWMLQREESPWYPTMRIIRQRAPGDWPELLQRVGARLKQHQVL